jgi:GntR family transcriptional repressor for pyruvate dehydrogenase complex
MLNALKPVRTESLKEVCVTRFEELVLSGELAVGQKLPPERELALQLGVSRPVVHEALVDIAAKGLVSLIPRVGTVVNDFRTEGSIALLTSLLNYDQGKLGVKLLYGLLQMRMLFEVENARLAALNRTEQHLVDLQTIFRQETHSPVSDVEQLTQLDFDFHLKIAIASDNLSYPLLLNSFKPVYTNLSGQFFSDPTVVPFILSFHEELVNAIAVQDDQQAIAVMRRMLAHGEARLQDLIAK